MGRRRRQYKGPGRNAPCPCGSGRKFKSCCESKGEGPATGPERVVRPELRAHFKRAAHAGCYDDTWFTEVEKRDATVAEDYAHFALVRGMSREEEHRVRDALELVTTEVLSALPPEVLVGSCNLVTNVMVRFVEALGVWAFGVHGSVRFVFPRHPHLDPSYFWVVDEQDFQGAFTGHAWLVAPPFVVDCTARLQKWQGPQATLLPDRVVAHRSEVEVLHPQPDLFAAPRVARFAGPPHPALFEFWQWMPAIRVRLPEAHVTYQPSGIVLPQERLGDDGWALSFGNRTPAQFFEQVILPAWAERGRSQ